MTAPRRTSTFADPPRGYGPAWERPGAQPAAAQLPQGVSCNLRLQKLCELREGRQPAAFVVVALGHVVELRVHEVQLGAAGDRPQLDAHTRGELGHAAAGPGEGEPAVCP